jgi:hypothetical protein
MTAAIVEIVAVLVVAEQHRIDGADVLGAHGRTAGLRQGHVRQFVVARTVEGRIGDEAEAGDLDQHGRTADQGETRCGHGRPPVQARTRRISARTQAA